LTYLETPNNNRGVTFAANSPVFKAMLENDGMIEKRKGEIEISDVSSEVMDQFLHFLYSGRFTNKRSQEGKEGPVWVGMLPQLVYVADKVLILINSFELT